MSVAIVQGVDHMLLQVGQEEVTFQTGFQAADYQSMLATTINSGLQKRLTVIKARIIKHMERDYDLMERVSLALFSATTFKPLCFRQSIFYPLKHHRQGSRSMCDFY